MRPGLKEVLRELKNHFELILFTSSSKIYCDGILKNVIECEETLFDFKLFKNHLAAPRNFIGGSRHMSSQQGDPSGSLIKNLDILLSGRTLSDLLIVDNRSAMYCDHVFNGIPISDYQGDPKDRALYLLKEYLMRRILPVEDVRQSIKEDFLDAIFT